MQPRANFSTVIKADELYRLSDVLWRLGIKNRDSHLLPVRKVGNAELIVGQELIDYLKREVVG